MKLLIASDLHGSCQYGRQVLDLAQKEQVDFIVLLGDVLYHGPRNPLPEGHGPKELAAALNQHAHKIICVRGNCDAEVDQMMLDFPCLSDYALLFDGSVGFYLTHGHLASPSNLPKLCQGEGKRWVFAYGHTHVKQLERTEQAVLLNPGSTSLPKDGSRSVALYRNGTLSLVSLEDGSVMEQLQV